jgi:hypothetical protein
MKNKNLIQILLGSGLALQVCATPVPQPDIFTVASDFSVIGSPGSGTLSQSSAENFSAAGNASSDVDGSSVYGAQSVSCAGGTFIGLGSVSVNAGLPHNNDVGYHLQAAGRPTKAGLTPLSSKASICGWL